MKTDPTILMLAETLYGAYYNNVGDHEGHIPTWHEMHADHDWDGMIKGWVAVAQEAVKSAPEVRVMMDAKAKAKKK